MGVGGRLHSPLPFCFALWSSLEVLFDGFAEIAITITMEKDLIKTVQGTIKRFEMLKAGDRLLLAVSGGPDSVFMLHVLNILKEDLGINIYVANLDHGLRGRASEIDSEFVKHFSESLDIPFIHKKINLKKTHETAGLSKEEIARKARYDFLIGSAKKAHACTIATGHTLDDHAETVLMRIIKGSSMRGLTGIPPMRFQDGLKIIRPLIDITKKEIEVYLKSRSIPYRIDRSNLEHIYFRNSVRNSILPFLEKYNPKVKHALVNLAEGLREDFDFIEEEKRKKAFDLSSKRNRLSLKLKDMIIQPRALRKEIIRDALAAAGADIKKLSYRHWKDMDNFIMVKQKGKSIDLPGGVRINKGGENLIFFKLKG